MSNDKAKFVWPCCGKETSSIDFREKSDMYRPLVCFECVTTLIHSELADETAALLDWGD